MIMYVGLLAFDKLLFLIHMGVDFEFDSGQNASNLLATNVKPPSNAVTPVYTINPP
jgi:hypothetical protein